MHTLQRMVLVVGLILTMGLLLISCTDEIEMVQVHFDSREGSSLDAVGVAKGNRLSEPENPQREGYAFAGWYKESTCSTAWNFTTDVVDADTLLYAKWTPTVQTLRFDANGGDRSMGSLTLATGQEASLPTCAFINSGYVFTGWSTSPDGEREYSDEGRYTMGPVDQTLYALWIPLCYISLDMQGGFGGDSQVIAVLGEPMPANVVAPQKPGFIFCGYSDQPSSGGTLYFAADMSSVRNWDSNPAGTATLYAQWIPDSLSSSAGGHVFYDKGSYSDGWQYLEAAPVSTQWVAKQWSSAEQFRLVGAADSAIGDGYANTNLIVDELGQDGEYAALLCANLSVEHDGVTYDDWFLPSHDELALMYQVLHQSGLGGFFNTYYWSSSERSSAIAFMDNFSDPTEPLEAAKTYCAHVRAIRAF